MEAPTEPDAVSEHPGFSAICDAVASGEPLTAACARLGLLREQFHRMIRQDATGARRDAYTRATTERAEAHADRIAQVCDDVLAGRVPPDAGRVALEALKWSAAKLDRARYGDQPAQTVNNLNVGIVVTSPETQERVRAAKQRAIARTVQVVEHEQSQLPVSTESIDQA